MATGRPAHGRAGQSARDAVAIEAGDRVVVTGASGLHRLGGGHGRCSRAAPRWSRSVEPGGDERNLDGWPSSVAPVDMRDGDAVRCGDRRARGSSSTWPPCTGSGRADPADFYDVNVGGTLNVLEAARAPRRANGSSTPAPSDVLGLDGAARGIPADETSYADVAHLFGLYKRTKYVAEHEVLRAAAQGLPVSWCCRPSRSGPVIAADAHGQGRRSNSSTGACRRFVDTTFNVVHVDDLAAGHLLAAERGEVGRSYIVGGENLAMREFLGALARATGLTAPTRQVPRAVALGAGGVSQLVEGRLAAP